MKIKKAILLFEVALVVLLLSLVSVFLFRGYALFIRTAAKAAAYNRLSLLAEKKIWDAKTEQGPEAGQGFFDDSRYSWQMDVADTDYESLKKVSLRVDDLKQKVSLDTVFYVYRP